MKNINKYLSFAFAAALIAVSFTSCEDEDKARVPQFTNGGFVKFVSAPVFEAGSDGNTAAFTANVEDPSDNVASYEVRVAVRPTLANTGITTDTLSFSSTTTFPFDVSFSGADMAALFNTDASNFSCIDSNPSNNNPCDDLTEFEFFAVVTTVDGAVFDSTQSVFIPPSNPIGVEPGDPEYVDPSTPGFIPRPGMWNGGRTDNVLLTAPGLLQALNWVVTFEDPAE